MDFPGGRMHLQSILPISKGYNITVPITINVCPMVYSAVWIVIQNNIMDSMKMTGILPGKDSMVFVVVANIALVKFPHTGTALCTVATSFRPGKTTGVAAANITPLYSYCYRIT